MKIIVRLTLSERKILRKKKIMTLYMYWMNHGDFKGRGPGQNKRFWSEDEDKHLIESLIELNNERKFKAEGNFKPGHLRTIEMKLKERMPGCDIQAKPYIESRMKTLKTDFQIVHETLTGSFCSGFGWDSNRKTVTAEKSVWEAYLQRYVKVIRKQPIQDQVIPWYDSLCAVFGKDRTTGKYAETISYVVEELEAEKKNTTLGGDDFSSANNLDEVESMSVSNTTRGAQSHTQLDGSSKKKRKAANHEELSMHLHNQLVLTQSKAIGEDLNEKHMQLGKELEMTTTLTTAQRHKVARMIMQDNALVSYFFSVPDDENDEWARLLFDGSL
ncbi:hypothetical protein F8388_007129 [Cannabis sativa]|uniref:Myb/SANT-like domain-containing protein n=1 Tax=Cannabis sativa TaxID=3483 RepID=A0A7J6DWV7_CANSA|nr:hypothetical protein G4B88_030094 [Cannabis sativa]KAF4357593.1 hypothetical protein F8388_007129 [Cannabis sativa]